jgi:hypothetical protein
VDNSSKLTHLISNKYNLKEVCFGDDSMKSLEFYEVMGEVILKLVASQILTAKEFTNHFMEHLVEKIRYFSVKSGDYGE